MKKINILDALLVYKDRQYGFHGTTVDRIPNILKHGLNPTKKNKNYNILTDDEIEEIYTLEGLDMSSASENRENNIYFFDKYANAEEFSKKIAKNRSIDPAILIFSPKKNTNPYSVLPFDCELDTEYYDELYDYKNNIDEEYGIEELQNNIYTQELKDDNGVAFMTDEVKIDQIHCVCFPNRKYCKCN